MDGFNAAHIRGVLRVSVRIPSWPNDNLRNLDICPRGQTRTIATVTSLLFLDKIISFAYPVFISQMCNYNDD